MPRKHCSAYSRPFCSVLFHYVPDYWPGADIRGLLKVCRRPSRQRRAEFPLPSAKHTTPRDTFACQEYNEKLTPNVDLSILMMEVARVGSFQIEAVKSGKNVHHPPPRYKHEEVAKSEALLHSTIITNTPLPHLDLCQNIYHRPSHAFGQQSAPLQNRTNLSLLPALHSHIPIN